MVQFQTYLSDILHVVAQGLLVPDIILLLALIGYALFCIGSLIVEIFTEHKHFTVVMPKFLNALVEADEAGIPEVVEASGLLNRQKQALMTVYENRSLPGDALLALIKREVEQEESRYDSITSRNNMAARVAPMLGLMGTLIPLGPGIEALGRADTATLSSSLLVAFDTTVAGLVVAAVCLVIGKIRGNWYENYLSALEAAMATMLEKIEAMRSTPQAVSLRVDGRDYELAPAGAHVGEPAGGAQVPVPVQASSSVPEEHAALAQPEEIALAQPEQAESEQVAQPELSGSQQTGQAELTGSEQPEGAGQPELPKSEQAGQTEQLESEQAGQAAQPDQPERSRQSEEPQSLGLDGKTEQIELAEQPEEPAQAELPEESAQSVKAELPDEPAQLTESELPEDPEPVAQPEQDELPAQPEPSVQSGDSELPAQPDLSAGVDSDESAFPRIEDFIGKPADNADSAGQPVADGESARNVAEVESVAATEANSPDATASVFESTSAMAPVAQPEPEPEPATAPAAEPDADPAPEPELAPEPEPAADSQPAGESAQAGERVQGLFPFEIKSVAQKTADSADGGAGQDSATARIFAPSKDPLAGDGESSR